MPLAGTGKALVYQTTKWWSQLKTPGAAVYANRHYLNVNINQLFSKVFFSPCDLILFSNVFSKQLFRERKPERLASGSQPTIIGDVFIHPTADIHPTAVVCQYYSQFQ